MSKDNAMSSIIDSWKERQSHNLMSNQRTMSEKIIREFKKISKEDILGKCIEAIYQVVFYDAVDQPLYNHLAYPRLNQTLDDYLSEHMKSFYDEAQVINEDGFNLMTYLEFQLNNFNESNLYWCSYPQISHDIIEDADTYSFTLIRYNKALYDEAFMYQGALHPFIKSLSLTWSALFKEASYDNCFRKSASSMNALLGSIWDSINVLSSLKYEGSNNNGGLLFIDQYTPHLVLTLESPVPLTQHRSIRKLLQMSRKGHYLLINQENIAIGFGSVITVDPVFRIEFLDHLNWRLYYGQQEFLSCTNLLPRFPNGGSDITKLKEQLAITFEGLECETYRIISVLQAAKLQNKGTMIVISENAISESQRLASSSILIKPIELTTSQVNLITGIDGAVIMDPKGICYAIGSILDGFSTDNGDPSRGARFNSALRYMNSQLETRCMIVVVSEDKYFDILTSR